jgi:hypothetical protein
VALATEPGERDGEEMVGRRVPTGSRVKTPDWSRWAIAVVDFDLVERTTLRCASVGPKLVCIDGSPSD